MWLKHLSFINSFLSLPAVDCPGGQVYRSCISSCSYTCSSIAADPICLDNECVEGCGCPQGQALNDNDDCVPVAECPCLFGDEYFDAGKGVMIGSDYW